MRIQKYLSEKGIASRREAEKLMTAGLVKVNNKVIRELWTQINPERDKVEILKTDAGKKGKTTVAFYKPRGIVSSKSSKEGETIFDFAPQFKGLNAVGRLDKESEGLILLSNDGVITKAVTGSDLKIGKEYEVCVLESIKPRHIKKMEEGIMIDDKKTLPAKVEQLSDKCFKIILREGRHHQIRRMCAAVYLTIDSLKRVRIGNIKLRNLKVGESRILSNIEVDRLKAI